MKKAGKITAIILLGMVIAFNLSTAVRNLSGVSDEFDLLPFTLLTVKTGSMEPDLSAGDLIIIREISYDDLQIGDIITYRRSGELITHRLIRFEGSRLITKGTANTAEDKSVGPDEYLGKVVAVLPGMGAILSCLRNPVGLLCLAFVIFGLFYLPGIVLSAEQRGKLRKKTEETGKLPQTTGQKKVRYRGVLKFSGFLAVLSILLLTPTMTEARYAALINGQAALAADYRYMGSNLLTDAGAVLEVGGWTGNAWAQTVNVKNSENLLKYNKQGQDLTYRFIVMKMVSREGVTFRTDYDLNIQTRDDIPEASSAAASSFAYSPAMEAAIGSAALNTDKTYVLAGSDSGPAKEEFNVSVVPREGVTYEEGDQLGFKVYAVTSYRDGYYFCKSAEVILTASESGDFIENVSKHTSPGNAVLNYQFQTGLYGGAEVRDVIVRWDSTVVSINEYEDNAFEIIHNRAGEDSYFAGSDTDHNAWLILPLSAYATVKLEFFKEDIASNGTDIQITASVVETEEE